MYWQFVHAIKGMAKACLKFETPVTGGNVSFYNQSKNEQGEVPVFPTPTIGMVGIVPDKNNIMTLDFKEEGDSIFLLGTSRNDIGSSEYLYSFHRVKYSPAPYLDLDEEYVLQSLVQKLIREKLIRSAHDVSDGGLFTTLLESSLPRNLGFSIATDEEFRKDAFLFGESQSRVIVSVAAEQLDAFVEMLADTEIDFVNLGEVNGDSVIIDGRNYGRLQHFRDLYENAIGNLMKQEVHA